MIEFRDLTYITEQGHAAPYDRRCAASPHNPNWDLSETAMQVINDKLLCMGWEHSGKQLRLHDIFLGGAALDTSADLLVVKLKTTGQVVAIQPDGVINHIVEIPDLVFLKSENDGLRSIRVEGVDEVLPRDGRVLIGLLNRFEFVQRRFHDAKGKQWQEIAENYRKWRLMLAKSLKN